MNDFSGYDDFDRKLELSEGIEQVRENRMEDKKKVEGYEPNPADESYYEVMGIRNSFDNVSVGADKHGQMLISVTSQKQYGKATLDSEKKRLKGTRRKKKIGEYGDLYTNPASDRNGAFAFRADPKISDIRMYRQFRELARAKISAEQREAAPFLRLDDDLEQLRSLQAQNGSDAEGFEQRQVLQKRVQKETESRDRFMTRLRITKNKLQEQTKEEKEPEPSLLHALLAALDAGDTDENQADPPDEITPEPSETEEPPPESVI